MKGKGRGSGQRRLGKTVREEGGEEYGLQRWHGKGGRRKQSQHISASLSGASSKSIVAKSVGTVIDRL